MKILNLYAGIGGNRKLWGEEHEITAIEIDEERAKVYQKLFSKDKVIVGDAHQFLLENYKDFDFIWSSPPCPTHGQLRFRTRVLAGTSKAVYPDMKLYEEIIFLIHHFEGLWVVENVESYYEPLIKPKRLQRHFFWSNFDINEKSFNKLNVAKATKEDLAKFLGYDIEDLKLKNQRLVLRDCVLPDVGAYVLSQALNPYMEEQLYFCQNKDCKAVFTQPGKCGLCGKDTKGDWE